MTFEEQLTRAFQTLTERLRGDVERHVQQATAELISAAPYERDPAVMESARLELERAVATARRDAQQDGFAKGCEAGRAAALDELQARAAPVADPGPDPALLDGLHSIDRARTLSDILDALLTAASADGSHAKLWLVRGGALRPWRAAASADSGAEDAATPLDQDSAVGEAARINAVTRRDGVVAVPLALGGSVVAVLVVGTERRPDETDRPDADAQATAAGPQATSVEFLTRYAARSLEALTAFKTARALTQRDVVTAEAAAAPDRPAAEEDLSARRYARLLVAEIKLYHEADVVEGRRDRDLASRLGGEIARARVMYEQRVPADVQARVDFFHEELVRTLANGDATLLELRP